ncbi:hypothetical protein [Pelagicoccus sp. SDUM812003]|uniref:hypothetical protein n=1 Tax=Pelagicoccus sp. SDUM812003 TaxID=3041267 RepID=UPI00280F2644|nr:hypothetical protein [Pelagicoccus sp. SDUM812003]MDQ8201634.1 hypothetical protein [Pelagicoccus sp. SDUM812003]
MSFGLLNRNPNALARLLLALSGLLLSSCAQVKVANPKTNLELAPAPYFHTETGIYFPGALDELFRQPIVLLEERSPGLGVAISYRNNHARLDVFVYDLQASVIPVGIDSEVIEDSFQNAIDDIRKATKRRIYSNFVLRETGTRTLAGTDFLYADFTYGEDLFQKDGHLLVAGVNGQIIKIRSSITIPSDHDVWRAIGYLARAIEQSRRRGYGGLTLAEFESIRESLARIDLSDGLQEQEAISIAQMELVNRKRHHRFDPKTATLLETDDSSEQRVQFSQYPSAHDTPMPSLVTVEISPDGRASLSESP